MTKNLTDRDFKDDDEKWEFLRTAPAVDAREPVVAELGRILWSAATIGALVGGNRERDQENFCRLAMAYCRDVIRYESDTTRTGGEDIQHKGELSDILERGTDDCDGKARLFVALCLAAKIPARMVDHWKDDPRAPSGRDLYHVSGVVDLPEHPAPVPAELTLYRARLGDNPSDFPRSVPHEVSGHWSRNDVGEPNPDCPFNRRHT